MKVHNVKVGKLLDPPSANISAISTKQVIYQITAATCGLVGRTLQSVSTADTTQQIGSRHASPEQEVMSTLSKLHQHYNINKLVCLRSPFFSSLEFFSFYFCKKTSLIEQKFPKTLLYLYYITFFWISFKLWCFHSNQLLENTVCCRSEAQQQIYTSFVQ